MIEHEILHMSVYLLLVLLNAKNMFQRLNSLWGIPILDINHALVEVLRG